MIFIASAGLASAEPELINFTHLKSGIDLPTGGVTSVTQDHRGYIWLGTNKGLWRYDGYDMRSYELAPGEEIRENQVHIAEFSDPDELVAATDRAVYLLSPDSGQSRKLKINSEELVTSVVPTLDGKLWIGGSHGVILASKGNTIDMRFLEESFVSALHLAPDHFVMAGTREGYVFKIEKTVSPAQELWKGNSRINALIIDQENHHWIGTSGEGLIEIASTGEVIKKHNTANGLPSNDIRCLFQDSLGTLWVGTANGLLRKGALEETFTVYQNHADEYRSLTNNEINCIFEDKRKVLWIGHQAGACRFAIEQSFFQHLRHLSEDSYSPSHNSIVGVYKDSKERLWLATPNSLDVIEKGKQRTSYCSNHKEISITVIHPDGETACWIGTKGQGLLHCDVANKTELLFVHDPEDPTSIRHNSVNDLIVGPEGHLWVATNDGLCKYSQDTSKFETIGDRLGINCLYFHSDGTLIIGSEEAGLLRLKDEGEMVPLIDSLSSFQISSLLESKSGDVWVGTKNSGVFIVNGPKDRLSEEHFHTDNSDLPDNQISGIEEDSEGNIWISTERGLTQFHPLSKKFRNFDLEDGLQSMTFFTNSHYKDKKGFLYFGGPVGINIIDPNNLPLPRVARQPILTGLEINGAEIVPSSDDPYLQRPLMVTDQLVLPFDKGRRLSFLLATLDYTTPVDSKFRFKISPIESSWTYANTERKATYTGLPVGNFTLEAQASLDGKTWNQNNAQIKISIKPPWYQTWWAISGFAAIILGTLAALVTFFIFRHNANIRIRNERLENDRRRAESALSSELQRAMLLRQTTDEMKNNNIASAFSTTLKEISDHLKASWCAIYEYSPELQPHFRLLSEHFDEKSTFSAAKMPPDHQIFSSTIGNRSASILQKSTHANELPHTLDTMLAIRTANSGNTNGLLVVSHEKHQDWPNEDVKLMENMTNQIGIAIAHHRFTIADAQQRTALRSARLAAEKANQAKSDFLAKMTHELRTPLSAILGFAQLLDKDQNLTTEQKYQVGLINSGGEHLLETINGILDMSKIEAGQMEINEEQFDLEDLLASVEGLLKMRAQMKNLTLQMVRYGDLPALIHSDKTKIRQVLINLIGNAIKFTRNGGITVKVAVKAPEFDGDRTHLFFEIADTGAGISEEDLKSLFEEFTQTASGKKSGEGTGLGLPISKKFVEFMGGQMSATSTVGVGTAFTFNVLCDIVSQKHPVEKTTPLVLDAPAQDNSQFQIMIAEDQVPNRMLLRTYLEMDGYTVLEAHNGREAVEGWIKWQPDLIFMDNEMPIMNGMEATREIIRTPMDKSPKIISLTAFALESYREMALNEGCVDFLTKPFQKEDLRNMIDKHLHPEMEVVLS